MRRLSSNHLLEQTFETANYNNHSSEKRDLRSTKCSSKMLHNLLYFLHKKTHNFFPPLHFSFFFFWIWGSISCMKYSKFWNILLTISLSLNLLFLKSVLLGIFTMSLHKKTFWSFLCYKKGKENIRREFSSSLIMIINCMFDFQQSI